MRIPATVTVCPASMPSGQSSAHCKRSATSARVASGMIMPTRVHIAYWAQCGCVHVIGVAMRRGDDVNEIQACRVHHACRHAHMGHVGLGVFFGQ